MKGLLMTPMNIELTVKGLKTQTRRTAGLEEINKEPDAWEIVRWNGEYTHALNGGFQFQSNSGLRAVKPRYNAGETVYLKEAWASMLIFDELSPNKLDTNTPIWFKDTPPDEPTNCGDDMGKWRSPMFMFAKDARYFLKIISVRLERLEDISWNDCLAEGIIKIGDAFYPPNAKELGFSVPQGAYFYEWDSINGVNSSRKNEWVWVYTYQLTDRPVE